MIRQRNLLLLLVFVAAISSVGFAYVPPLTVVLREICDGRKTSVGSEILFKHRIANGSDVVELEERWVSDKAGAWVSWKSSDGGPVVARWERGSYAFGTEQIVSRSNLFIAYFTSESADALRDSLLREQMIRRDQLYQYKPNYNPSGDPSTWDLMGNILFHDDLTYARLESGVAIRAKGSEGKAVYFDRELKGIRRLEWSDGANIWSWNFSHFSSSGRVGLYPRSAIFEKNKSDLVHSEVVGLRALNAKQLSEATKIQRARQSSSGLGNYAEALRILLSYR